LAGAARALGGRGVCSVPTLRAASSSWSATAPRKRP